MKKLFLCAFVFGLLFSFTNVSAASVKMIDGCTLSTKYSATTGKPCGTVLGASTEGVVSMYLEPGMKGTEVLKLQVFLNKQGYLKVTPDGNYGPKTTEAVQKFQIANKLLPTGSIDGATSAALDAVVEQDESADVGASTLLSTPQCVDKIDNDNDGTVDYPFDSDCSSATDDTEGVPVTTTTCTATSAPYLKVLSPNGGEIYQINQQITVTWKGCDPAALEPYTVTKLELIDTVTHARTLIAGVGIAGPVSTALEDGYMFTIPGVSNGVPVGGSHYRISVEIKSEQAGGFNKVDISDADFTINNPTIILPTCTGPFGYSPVIGAPCSTPITWVVGCTSANGISTVSGQSCNWSPVIVGVPQGCTTTGGYSVTTGQLCGSGFSNPASETIKLQSFLIKKGYLLGNADGKFGPKTTAALQKFQIANKLIPTGSVDAVTAAKLDTLNTPDEGATVAVKVDKPSVERNVTDTTPRIMYWTGKVNQHIDVNGVWQTDPDGVSGTNIPKLKYCQRWYPSTTSVVPYQLETISTWHDKGNRNNYTATIMSDKCVTEQQSPSVTVLSPNGGEVYQAGQQITVTWSTTGIPAGNNALIILNDQVHSMGGDLITSTTNDGIEIVTLPTTATWSNMQFGMFYNVRVSFAPFGGYTGAQLSDASDTLFTIQAPGTACSITSFTANPTIVNAGTASILSGQTNCRFVLLNTVPYTLSGPTTLTQSTGPLVTTAAYYMYAANTLPAGCTSLAGYSVTTGQPCTTNAHVASLRIAVTGPGVCVPHIAVTTPNGGQTYHLGQQVFAQWTGCDSTNNDPYNITKLELVNMVTGVRTGIIGTIWTGPQQTMLNDGYIFTIPNTPTLGTYRMYIQIVSQNGAFLKDDMSDNGFTIN